MTFSGCVSWAGILAEKLLSYSTFILQWLSHIWWIKLLKTKANLLTKWAKTVNPVVMSSLPLTPSPEDASVFKEATEMLRITETQTLWVDRTLNFHNVYFPPSGMHLSYYPIWVTSEILLSRFNLHNISNLEDQHDILPVVKMVQIPSYIFTK